MILFTTAMLFLGFIASTIASYLTFETGAYHGVPLLLLSLGAGVYSVLTITLTGIDRPIPLKVHPFFTMGLLGIATTLSLRLAPPGLEANFVALALFIGVGSSFAGCLISHMANSLDDVLLGERRPF